MNVNWIQLKGLLKVLGRIETQLTRIADCLELDLASTGVHVRPPVADTRGPEPTMGYVDEEMDWARENIPQFEKLMREAEDNEP